MKRLLTFLGLCSLTVAAFGAPIEFAPGEVKINGDLGAFKSHISSELVSKDVYLVTVKLTASQPTTPPKFSLEWSVPSVDVHGFWTASTKMEKANYYNFNVTSRAATFAPVMSLYNLGDTNRFTVACSEAMRKVSFDGELKEEDARFHFTVTFFDEREAAMTEWSAQLRVDLRALPYHRALHDVAEWWAKDCGETPLHVPDAARRPMYSTWYAFHQTLDADELVAECERAKPLGFDSIIVDDGWQTLDAQRGYAFTGDWKPERLTEMRKFSDRVHALGMKVLLWYSVPFVGENATNHARFKGKYLRNWASQKTDVLDPRYPEVREFIIQTYVDAVRDWDLDGLKLDFIDFFTAQGDTKLTAEDGRDHASVNEAVDRLMTDVTVRLKEIRPEILIEFRQAYIGPLMRKYGNMFRAADCPNMAVVNRVRTLDLRLLSGNTAVHSDMYMWHPDEPVERAAQQLLNVLFSVPQLSVRLDTLPANHLAMVKFWTGYWNSNRATLMDGELQPARPSANYPSVTAVSAEKTIVALYDVNFTSLETLRDLPLDIVNASAQSGVVLQLGKSAGKCRVEVLDAQGKVVASDKQTLKAGTHSFKVPSAGLLRIVP